jgi:hypothetical protein
MSRHIMARNSAYQAELRDSSLIGSQAGQVHAKRNHLQQRAGCDEDAAGDQVARDDVEDMRWIVARESDDAWGTQRQQMSVRRPCTEMP